MEKRKELDPIQIEIIFLYLENPIAAQEKVNKIFWQTIQHFGTQSETAKKLNLIQQTFNYRLNYAKTIHLEDVLMMLKFLRSKKAAKANWKDFINALTISERTRIALDDLEKSRQPRGRRRAKNRREGTLICQNSCEDFDKLHHRLRRLDDKIAEKYGFGNRMTFWQAVEVARSGCPNLIAAVDAEKMTIYKASRVSRHTFEIQEQLVKKELLKQRNKARLVYSQSKKIKTQKYPTRKKLLQAFKTDRLLNTIEQKTQEPIIKRIEEVLHHFVPD